MTTAEQITKKIRVAGYADDELLYQLDQWCAANGKNRTEGLRYIIRTMLNIQDGSEEAKLQNTISMFESHLKHYKKQLQAA